MSFFPRKTSCMSLLFIGLFVMAHDQKHHSSITVNPKIEEKSDHVKINDIYLSEIKPIFEKKCFDCHGLQSSQPWYRNFPGVKQLIDHDMEDAKKHLDMTSDFPFKSHASPIEDLEAIQETIEKDEMPPFRYRFMHSESNLTDSEKEKVYKWVRFGKELLKENPR